jgi:hypothetical protein
MYLLFVSYVSDMELEKGNNEINGDIFSRRWLLFVFEEVVTEINESSRSKAVSQWTHEVSETYPKGKGARKWAR